MKWWIRCIYVYFCFCYVFELLSGFIFVSVETWLHRMANCTHTPNHGMTERWITVFEFPNRHIFIISRALYAAVWLRYDPFLGLRGCSWWYKICAFGILFFSDWLFYLWILTRFSQISEVILLCSVRFIKRHSSSLFVWNCWQVRKIQF